MHLRFGSIRKIRDWIVGISGPLSKETKGVFRENFRCMKVEGIECIKKDLVGNHIEVFVRWIVFATSTAQIQHL